MCVFKRLWRALPVTKMKGRNMKFLNRVPKAVLCAALAIGFDLLGGGVPRALAVASVDKCSNGDISDCTGMPGCAWVNNQCVQTTSTTTTAPARTACPACPTCPTCAPVGNCLTYTTQATCQQSTGCDWAGKKGCIASNVAAQWYTKDIAILIGQLRAANVAVPHLDTQ